MSTVATQSTSPFRLPRPRAAKAPAVIDLTDGPLLVSELPAVAPASPAEARLARLRGNLLARREVRRFERAVCQMDVSERRDVYAALRRD
jgi:hypothetical protein